MSFRAHITMAFTQFVYQIEDVKSRTSQGGQQSLCYTLHWLVDWVITAWLHALPVRYKRSIVFKTRGQISVLSHIAITKVKKNDLKPMLQVNDDNVPQRLESANYVMIQYHHRYIRQLIKLDLARLNYIIY